MARQAASESAPHEVVIPALKSAGDAQRAKLHKAALEWSVLAPIIIRSIEDVKSRPRWSSELTPFVHQYENLFTFCRRLPVSLVADDVGLGKTITAGLILSELIVRQRVSRALILCPKILCGQWQAELANKFGISAFAASGTASLEQAVESEEHSVVISTYHSALKVLPRLDSSRFEMLILDEAHKLRNLFGTSSSPQIAVRVKEALEKRIFSFVLMLTATPIHNRLWDIYSLIDLLSLGRSHANPFGDESTFRWNYIDTSHPGDRVLRSDKKDDFRAVVREYMMRTRRLDAALPFPERTVRNVVLPLSREEGELFDEVGEVIEHLGGLEQASLAKALLGSPQALAAQLDNMKERHTFLAPLSEKVNAYSRPKPLTAKLAYLSRLVEELRSKAPDKWRLLIFTERRETQESIRAWCESSGVSYGLVRGGESRANQQSIDRFKADPPGAHVLISTDSGAEGVNLQVCNYVVNFDLPWNPMLVEQRIGRVQRLASTFQEVVVCNLVLDHPADAHVVGILMAKLAAIGSAVDDIESVLEDLAGTADGDDGEETFAATIQDLVVRALQRRDVTRDRAILELNIENAQRKKREHEKELEEIFGALSDEPPAEVQLPDLAYPEPSHSVQEFVLQAKAMDGSINVFTDDVFVHRSQEGTAERFTFDKEIAAAATSGPGERVSHYDAGTPAFQRLVAKWAENHHCVVDHTCNHPDKLKSLVSELLADKPFLAVTSANKKLLETRFIGQVLVRVQSDNGVDRYEKLIAIGEPIETTDPPLSRQMRPEDLPEDLRQVVRDAVSEDPDISAFVDYYSEKRRTEAARANGDVTRLARVNANFQSRLSSRVVAAQGAMAASVTTDVRYTIQGQGDYSSRFVVDTHEKRFVEQPEWRPCQKLGVDVPVDALEECAVTSSVACRHLLVQSGVSGKWLLADVAVVCQISGLALLPDEAGVSDVSGRRVDKRLLIESEISGRQGVRDEIVRCAFTGDTVLRDEVQTSAVSGWAMRKDLAVLLGDGRYAHESELQRCPVTDAMLPDWEMASSDYSGVKAATASLVASDNPPHRRGLPSEMVRCAVTGKLLLKDEAKQTSGGEWAEAGLFVLSEISGQHALEGELERCEITGKVGLRQELGTSAVSGKRVCRDLLVQSDVSGELAMEEETARCELTGATGLPHEIIPSDLSGRRFRKDESVTLKDGRLCHETECRVSDATGDALPLDQGDYCSVSGKWVEQESLLQSSKSGRKALGWEFITCQITNQPMLPDEVAVSSTGVTGDRTMLQASDISGAAAFQSELVTCQETGRRGLPHELGSSDYSGKVVDKGLLEESPVGGRCGLRSEFKTCEISNAKVLIDELATSDVSGKKFRADQQIRGDDGTTGHIAEFVRCGISRKLLPVTRVRTSDVSGIVASSELLGSSEKNPLRWGLPQEIVTCAITGKKMLLDEVASSEVSGRVGDASLIMQSSRSGKRAFPDEFIICPATQVRLLPEEMASSDVSGARVSPAALYQSACSNRRGLAQECDRCEVTNVRVLRDELAVSDVSGRKFRADEQAIGTDGRRGHRSEFRHCEHSGQTLAVDQGDTSAVSGKWVGKQFLVTSENPPHRRGLFSEAVQCAITGKTLLSDEVATSSLTGRVGDKKHLSYSAASKTQAFQDELVACEETKQQLLPSETTRCEATGRIVDSRLVAPSNSSGRLALKRSLVACAVSGKMLLPDEVAKCEYTGKLVDATLLGTCNATKKRVLKSKLVRCDVPRGVIVNDDRIRVRSAKSGRVCPRPMAKRCQWTGGLLLPDEVSTCTLSGLQLENDFLRNQEFALLRDLLEKGETCPGYVDQSALLPWLNTLLAQHGVEAAAAGGVVSPDGMRAAIFADTKKRFWNKPTRVGLVASIKDSPAALSTVAFGTVTAGGWEAASQ